MAHKNWFIQYLPQLLICSGVFLTAIGGWISYKRMLAYRSENVTLGKENKELNSKNLQTTTEIKEFSEENISLAEKNQKLINENTFLTQKNQELIQSNIEIAKSNAELSNKLIEESEVIKSEITGGNSYLRLKIQYQELYKNICVFFNIQGDYNLRNVQLYIFEIARTDLLNGFQEHLKQVYKKDFTAININNSNVELIKVSGKPTSLFYKAIIRTGNRDYRQYFLFKRHTDNIWYNHSIYFDDENEKWFREEEFSSFPAEPMNGTFVAKYTDYIKTQPPLVENLITYDKTNSSSIKQVEKIIKSKKSYDDKKVSKLTNTPLFIVKRIRNSMSSK